MDAWGPFCSREINTSEFRTFFIFPLKKIEYGVYGELIIIYPKPYSIYLRGTIGTL